MCNPIAILSHLTSIILTAVLLLGCTGESEGGSAGGGATSVSSGSGNPDADKALMAKIEDHWVKTKDGWTTEFVEQLPLNPPVKVLKQYREFKYTFATEPLSEADRLNGVEWKSWADFGMTALRYWREEGNFEYPKGWSQWREDSPWYRPAVYKRNGQWIVEDPTLGSMFEGVKPSDIPGS